MGLQQAVALCMHHCHDAELTSDDAWFKTVVLSGGTASLPGLPGTDLDLNVVEGPFLWGSQLFQMEHESNLMYLIK